MSDGYDLFKTADGGEPPDGVHTAELYGAVWLPDTKNGKRIKFTWQTTDNAHYWEDWRGVEGKAKPYTQATLHALGIDYKGLRNFEDLAEQLALREGNVYEVEVKHNGDWLNTTVLHAAEGQPPPDVPADTDGLPAAGERTSTVASTAAGLFGDEDIPF